MPNHDVVTCPEDIRLRDWKGIAVRTFQRMMADQIGVLAGGIAFYAFLSIFPAIVCALMLWGLFTDMASLGAQLQAVRDFAPAAFDLVADQMVRIASQDAQGLTIGAVVAILLAWWSASGAVRAMIGAMNLAYHETERRGFIRLTMMSLGFTLAGIVFAILSILVIAAIPPILEALYLGQFLEALIRTVRWLLMVGLFFVAAAATYRFAPSRRKVRWRWVRPGAAVASVVWLAASILFSVYLQNFNAYNATFGSLGAVAALLMWFWLSAFAVCLGAALNAELELFATQDATVADAPAPSGARRAFVAGHAEDRDTQTEDSMQQDEVTKSTEGEHVPSSRLRSGQLPDRKVIQ